MRTGAERNGAGSRRLSAYTELLARAALTRLGINIAVPDSSGSSQFGWDLLAELEAGRPFKRLQVKAAKVRSGRVWASTVKQNGREHKCPYDGREFDYLVAVEPQTGVMWLLPINEVAGKRHTPLDNTDPWIGADEMPRLKALLSASEAVNRRSQWEQNPNQMHLFDSPATEEQEVTNGRS